MAYRFKKTISVRQKIIFIPLFAVFAFMLVKGLGWYQQDQIESFASNADRGTAIAHLLTQQLLLEDRYIREGNQTIYAKISEKGNKVTVLLDELVRQDSSAELIVLLNDTKGILDRHLDIYDKAAFIVNKIKEAKSRLTEIFHQNDQLLTKLTDSIALEASVLMIDGKYITPVKRELLYSLKEFNGFTSNSILNINDLLYFSNEEHYLKSEQLLAKRKSQVMRACDGLSSFTGDAKYRNGWIQIAKNQLKIDQVKIHLYSLWKSRTQLVVNLENINNKMQQNANRITSLSRQNIVEIKNAFYWIDLLAIILAILVVVFISVVLINGVIPPLINASEIISRISRGQAVELPAGMTQRRDEIGKLQTSVKRMLANTSDIVTMAKGLAAGNYEINLSPRSPGDELILALIEMNTALKAFKNSTEDRYREVVQGTDNLITRVDQNGNFTFVNYVGENIFGIKADNLVGMSAFKFLYPEDQEKTQKWFDECVRKKLVQSSIENRQINITNDEVFHMLWTSHFRFNENNELIEVNGIAHNITERKRAEEKVVKSNKRLMTILDSVPVDIYVSDMETNEILYMNAQMKESFGKDFTGEECWKAFRDGTEPCPNCTNPILLDKNQQPTGIKIWEDTNKISKKHYLNHDKAILWVDNRYVRIQIALDITERIQAEEIIKASLKEKETLIHEIHHRVKNNMAVIASLLKLQADNVEDTQIKEVLKESQSRVYAMSVVHETLHGSENLSEINLKTYLTKVTSSIFQTYSVSLDKVKLNSDIEGIPISIDRASPLGLIINELLSNSLKYAFPDERKGQISVSMKQRNQELELIIKDDGVGMPDGFDWENPISLGLKLVRTLVENQLDGSIDMKSTNGTKFTIKFNIET